MTKLENLLDRLMNLDEDTLPCESNIPCPCYTPNKETYCACGNCVEGMVILIKKYLKEERV